MLQTIASYFRPWAQILGIPAPAQATAFKGGTIWANLATYLLPTFLTLIAAFVVASTAISASAAARLYVLRVYLAVFATLWIAAALTLVRWKPHRFLQFAGWCGAAVLPTAGMTMSLNLGLSAAGWFWISLVLWCVVAIWAVWNCDQGWQRVLIVLGTLWTVSGLITTLGSFSIIPYARDAIDSTAAVHIFLDVRTVLGVLFFAAVAATAFQRAWGRRIDIPPITRVYIPPIGLTENIVWRALLRSFVLIGNVVLAVVFVLLDVLLGLVVTFLAFFLRIGEEAAKILRGLVANKAVLSSILTVVATFLLLVVLYYTAFVSATIVPGYLGAASLRESLPGLGLLMANVLIGTVCVTGVTWLFEEHKSLVVEAGVTSLMFLLSFLLVTSLVMFGGARVEYFGLGAFRDLGPFSIVLLLLIGIGMVVRLWTGVTRGVDAT